MMPIFYRKLRKYKYQVMEDYTVTIALKPKQDIDHPYISLSAGGQLTVRKRYAWDGPSGPTFDTKSFMRGSLVHDALYQLMRLSLLDHKADRRRADEILRDMCKADGMLLPRTWWVYYGVRWFGKSSAAPEEDKGVEIITAP
ncbi:DUF1353 domain-containing protein [candidate division KSB1 bacterium]|nr:DUF1353 domain-containing protein [candidate division KSB1 bacterium]